MDISKSAWSDERVERIVSEILRTGVILASVLVLIGGTLYLIQNGSNPPMYHVFRGEPAELRTVHGVLLDALALSRRGIIQLGLLLLLATPVVRVAFSVFAFALLRDRTYVLITLIVFVLLLYSMFGNHSGF
jgi:uncharacterized membrane protein